MRKNSVTKAWVYAGLVVAGSVGAAYLVSSATKQPLLKPGDRILLVGDELSSGLRIPLAALAKEAGHGFKHLGKEGSLIIDWALDTGHGAALEAELTGWRPTVVVFCLGAAEEAAKKRSPSTNAASQQAPSLGRLLGKVKASGARPLWLEPPTTGLVAPELRKLVRDAVGVDHSFPSERYVLQRQLDGVHPTAKGYAAWGGAIWRWLETGRAPASITPPAADLGLVGAPGSQPGRPRPRVPPPASRPLAHQKLRTSRRSR